MKDSKVFNFSFVQIVLLAVILLMLTCVEILASSGSSAIKTSEIGALNYPIDKTVIRNPWLIAAASNWPSMIVEKLVLNTSVPTEVDQERFTKWIRGTVNNQWLFNDIESVPYLTDLGFVHVKTNAEYQVRIREAQKPMSKGSHVMIKAIVMAITPLSGDIHLPKTECEFLFLLQSFLNPELGDFLKSEDLRMLTGECILPPVHKKLGGGIFLAVWPQKSSMGIQLYAWTDGKIMLVVFYEDGQYTDGPPRKPEVNPLPQPVRIKHL